MLTFKGFDTNASKVAVLVLAVLWILTLWWAKKSWIAWATIALVAALILVSLRSGFVLMVDRLARGGKRGAEVSGSLHWGHVVSLLGMGYRRRKCHITLKVERLIEQDTLSRKVNSSDASEYATMIGCCGSRFWGG